MGHYAIDKMNLRARETVYWPGISEDIKVPYHKCEICAVCKDSTERDTAVHGNTSSQMGTTWSRSVHIEKHILSSSLLIISVWFPVVRKLQSLQFDECHQTSYRNLYRNRCTQMHSLTWWHTIHITRVSRLYKKVGHTA